MCLHLKLSIAPLFSNVWGSVSVARKEGWSIGKFRINCSDLCFHRPANEESVLYEIRFCFSEAWVQTKRVIQESNTVGNPASSFGLVLRVSVLIKIEKV